MPRSSTRKVPHSSEEVITCKCGFIASCPSEEGLLHKMRMHYKINHPRQMFVYGGVSHINHGDCTNNTNNPIMNGKILHHKFSKISTLVECVKL